MSTTPDRTRRSRSRSPAESLICKFSTSGSQSQAQHRHRHRQSWSSNVTRSSSIMSNSQRISVHVGELLNVPQSPRFHPYAPIHEPKSAFGLSSVKESGSTTPLVHKPSFSERSRSASNSSSIGPFSIECGTVKVQPVDLPRDTTLLGVFPVPPSPLDHFEKWFPESPTEAALPLEKYEKSQAHLSKALPQPPYHVFERWKKQQLVLLVSFAGILSPLSTSIYFPTLTAISKEFNISNWLVLITITVYMAIQGIGPFLWMPLCSTFGRRPVFIITLLIFTGSSIGLIHSRTFLELTILRGVQSLGTAALTATCAAVIGDISTSKERSKYIGLFGGILMFTFISPLIGGVLTSFVGWRYIFWFLLAAGLTVLLLIILFLPETLRSIAGNGTIRLSSLQQPLIHVIKASPDMVSEPDTASTLNFKGPLTFLTPASFIEPLYCFSQKDVVLTTVFGAIAFAICTTIIATTTTMFNEHYLNLSAMCIGLAFLPAGAGSVLSFFTIGYLMDYDQRVTETHYRILHGHSPTTPLDFRHLPDFPIERARLRSMWWMALIFITSVGGYGFAFEMKRPTIAVPLIIQFIIASSATAILLMNGMLIADLFNGTSSVTPAVNCARFVTGALAVGTVQLSLDKIGAGFTFLAFAMIMLAATPIMLCQWFFGKPYQARRNSAWPRQRSSFGLSRGPEIIIEKVKGLGLPTVFKRPQS